jgi:DNA polymerase-3 subunit alpha
VLIQYRSEQAQATVRLGDEWRVFAAEELLLRLKRQLGNEAVEVKYR